MMKTIKIDVCFLEQIVMDSIMFMIPSAACCNPSFWIAKRCTLSRRDNASLTWTDSILLFVNVQEIFSAPNHNIKSVC